MNHSKVEELKNVLKGKKESEGHSSPPSHPSHPHSSHASSHSHPAQTPRPASSDEASTAVHAEMKALEEKLKQTQSLAKENEEKFIRLYAEFDNFKKRSEKERREVSQHIRAEVLQAILGIADDLDRALDHAGNNTDPKVLLEGIQLVKKQLQGVLGQFGVSIFKSLGEPFDPHVHEAVSQQESEHYPPNTVAVEYRKGYKIQDRLLRPAMVAVSSGAPSKNS